MMFTAGCLSLTSLLRKTYKLHITSALSMTYILILFTNIRLGFPRGLFPSCILINTLYTFLFSFFHTAHTYTCHPTLFDLTILTIFRVENKSWCSPLCNIFCLPFLFCYFLFIRFFYTVSVSVQNFLLSCIKREVRKLNYSVTYVFLHQCTPAQNMKTSSKISQCGLLYCGTSPVHRYQPSSGIYCLSLPSKSKDGGTYLSEMFGIYLPDYMVS